MTATMTPSEFQAHIKQMAESFRLSIELNVDAFDVDDAARKKRIEAVNDPFTGYRFFCETYFPHYLTSDPSLLHEDMYKEFPKILREKRGVKKIEIAFRGAAKSTHIALMFPIWCEIIGAKHYMPIIMDAFEQAAIALEAIKAEFEFNPRLSYDFPDHVGAGRTWREGEIITRSNVKIEAFGRGKKIRGRHHGPFRPDLILIDDIENDETVQSPAQRDKLENWILKAVLELGPPDGSMDVLWGGTILHFDAVLVRFTKKPGWDVSEFRAIINWPDDMDLWDQWEEVYTNEGEVEADKFYVRHKKEMDAGAVVNWPAVHTIYFLMKKRAGAHSAFASEYQNKPIADGNPFQKITFWVKRPPNLLRFGAIDPSLGKQSKGRDPSAILIGGYERLTGNTYLLEASIRKRLPDMIIYDSIELQRIYNCYLWFVENIAFQEFLRTSLMKEARKSGVNISAIPVTPYADKNLRIARLQPPVAAGLIQLHSTQLTLINQLQQWPNADHDDGPDCLDMLNEGILKYAVGGGPGGGIKTAGGNSSSITQGYGLR